LLIYFTGTRFRDLDSVGFTMFFVWK